MQRTAREGDVAPLFSTVLHTGRQFSLIDYRGRHSVVLFFYPRDFTTGCTAEACALRDTAAEFADADAIVLGISYDSSDTHARFARDVGMTVPLVADVDRSISRAYGAERLFGRSFGPKRMTVVIDREGIVRKVERDEFNPRGLVTRALAVLQRG
jgi:thioredoxin-dependent peroxiredoxin